MLLRRGYYDAPSGKGFGWDKAYWRHGVVNTNVFRDLISHSRPVQQGWHLSSMKFRSTGSTAREAHSGIAGCEDTGESVTMSDQSGYPDEGVPMCPTDGKKE